MKQFNFPVRNSGLNPFLTNPVVAVSQSDTAHTLDTFFIQHAMLSQNGIEVFGRWHKDPIDTYRCLNMTQYNLQIANLHEASRFEMLLESLKISI